MLYLHVSTDPHAFNHLNSMCMHGFKRLLFFHTISATLGVLCPYSEAWMKNFKLRSLDGKSSMTLAADLLSEDTRSLSTASDSGRAAGDDSGVEAPMESDAYIGPGASSDASCRRSACCLSIPGPGDRRQRQHYNTFEGRLWRMPACELRYGPLSCDFRLAPSNQGVAMDDEDLAQVGGTTRTSCRWGGESG